MTVLKTVKKIFQNYSLLLNIDNKPKNSVHRLLPNKYILLVSPHPDDEVLMGALAMRLQLENKMKVINVAVTLGSDKSKQVQRKNELTAACKNLKWENFFLPEKISAKKTKLKAILKKYQPTLIIAPHDKDLHPTHEMTSQLLKDCLGTQKVTVAWAEYWAQMKSPNTIIEVTEDIHLKQVRALEFHQGEISRNPYHIRLLGWQMDNVRRASEILAKKGANSASMLAGQLYRLEKWENGKSTKSLQNVFASRTYDLSDLIN
ncbi:MAG: PIG-L family deacetylase [Bacteriovoracaceae bacterium]|nr:PIG-L family deacetylase [Bacteriovoracaceae bacterium]